MRRAVAAVAVAALSLALALPADAGGRRQRCTPCQTLYQELLPDPAKTCAQQPPQPGAESPFGAADREIRALVLAGGGVKGVAYAGSFEALDAAGHYAGVEKVAGTSAGALVGVLVALGYTPDEIRSVFLGLDFSMFADGSKIGEAIRLIEDYGLHPGDTALCLLQCLVSCKLGMPDATFVDLAKKIEDKVPGYRDLHVLGTDLNRSESTVFCRHNEQTRDTPIALAARISMSFPVFFEAIDLEFEGEEDVWVDGGVLRNYAITLFDRPDPDPTVLGLHLGTVPPRRPIGGFKQYAEQLLDTLLAAQLVALCTTPADVERSVFIDTLGISTLDFNLTRQQKLDLMASGQRAVEEYLENGGSRQCPQRFQELLEGSERYPFPE